MRVGEDYAEQAVFTTTAYCLTCGPVMREHLPDGQTVTYHRCKQHEHPYADVTMPEEDRPLQ